MSRIAAHIGRRCGWAVLVAVALAGCGKAPDGGPAVRINGRTWHVEIAATPQARYTGLSGRTALAADRGMLFVFDDVRIQQFCMRGCEIPLDIAFIAAADGRLRIVHTATMAVEPDRAGRIVYGSRQPVRYALEVPAGALAAAGVKAGDEAVFLNVSP